MNRSIMVAVVTFVIGGLIGFMMADGSTKNTTMHQMSDGTMMANDEMMGHSMSMEDMMADMNSALMGKTGKDFDRAFTEQMIIHHEGAVQMAELALTNAENEDLKNLATEIIEAQTKEIELMNSWRASW